MTTFHLKAALVFIGACCGAVISQDWFSPAAKAFCAVLGAGCGALLAYILRPSETQVKSSGEPIPVSGPDGGPVKTEDVRQGN